MESRWTARLRAKIEEKVDTMTHHLLGGGAKTLEEYKDTTGELRGYKEALRFADEVDAEMHGATPGES